MSKKFIILAIVIVLIVVAVVASIYFSGINALEKDFEEKGLIGLGKQTITVELNESDIRDYTVVDSKFAHLNDGARVKLKVYMEINGLIIKPGKYTIGDNFSYERVFKELKFEKSTEN